MGLNLLSLELRRMHKMRQILADDEEITRWKLKFGHVCELLKTDNNWLTETLPDIYITTKHRFVIFFSIVRTHDLKFDSIKSYKQISRLNSS